MPPTSHDITSQTKKVIIVNNYEATKIKLESYCHYIYTYLELKCNSITELCFCNPAFHYMVSGMGLQITSADQWHFGLARIAKSAPNSSTKCLIVHTRHIINQYSNYTTQSVSLVPTLKQLSTAYLISCKLPTDIINKELPQTLQPPLKAIIYKPRFSIAPYDLPAINCSCNGL